MLEKYLFKAGKTPSLYRWMDNSSIRVGGFVCFCFHGFSMSHAALTSERGIDQFRCVSQMIFEL